MVYAKSPSIGWLKWIKKKQKFSEKPNYAISKEDTVK